jgi:hypothetical protein
MDPWLEQYWGDVHHRLITYICDQLQEGLPRGLRARVDERLFVEAEPGERDVYPDVTIIEQRPASKAGKVAGGGMMVAEPVIVRFPGDEVRQGYIEIVDARSGNRVVTAIEVLSPSNKMPGAGQELYLRKQGEYRGARVSTVEIDLLRAGERVTSVRQELLPKDRRGAYLICIRRGWVDWTGELYPVRLSEPLPRIGIPLRESDADVALDLQELLGRVYRVGHYDDEIDYATDPRPPLRGEDAAWADELLREKGLRK